MVFRTAFNYLSQASNQLLTGQTSDQPHRLIGEIIDVGGKQYSVRTQLAEGGFAHVFSVQETKTGEWFALKQQLAADRVAADSVILEIKFLKQLSGHPAIIRFHHATQLTPDKSGSKSSCSEFYILTELCSGGSLIDYVRRMELTVEQICKIFHAVSSAVQHMHDRNPPITHRDIKIENLLFDPNGFIKLCDFGSATTSIYRPDDDWNPLMRSELEEEMAKFTTPMYRSPEILETYQNYPIGPAQDIWALGCVLFYLCFRVHPFEDSAKLRIINARYTLPAQSQFQVFHDLIKQTLQPDPYSRPSIQDLCEQIEDVAMALNVNLKEPVLPPEQLDSLIPTNSQQTNLLTSQSAKILFDQGMNLIKTIKEKSPVVNISEQLRTQLGIDSAQISSRNTAKVVPPRPPAPPTQITQLTHKKTIDVQSKLDIDSISTTKIHTTANMKSTNEITHLDPFATTSKTVDPSNDFFNGLNWNKNVNPVEEQNTPLTSKEEYLDQISDDEIGVHSSHLYDPLDEFKQSAQNIENEFDLFNSQNTSFGAQHSTDVNKGASTNDVDLLKLLDEEIPQSEMHRNKSAPNFTRTMEEDESQPTKKIDDIFAEFLSQGSSTAQQENSQRPNYSRKLFSQAEVKSERPKNSAAAFDELLLKSHGFTPSSTNSNRTLIDLRKEQDAQEMDPVRFKIKCWTDGKQRNIVALLGSLSDVLWDEARGNWSQPSFAELFDGNKIKKHYRKACLVVHPDKQSGTVNEPLAKAIFMELNDAWNEFTKNATQ